MIAVLLLACGPGDPVVADPDAFPDGFRFGSATAGFQVDMGCPSWPEADCLDAASDWYDWVTDPGIVGEAAMHVTGEPLSHSPGMWETLEADADRMRDDGHTAYRMSVEWSRLFPDAVPDEVATVDAVAAYANPDAIARYHEMFAALSDRGITPLVTVNHYTLPRWIHDGVACHADLSTCPARGWVDRDRILHHVALYAGFVGREFGGDVDVWFTLNEPFATTLAGYLMPGEDRSAPPGLLFDVETTRAVMLAQIEGHAVMYDALHAQDAIDADGDGDAAVVGIVMNMAAIAPEDPDRPEDVTGAEHMDYLYHRLYLDAVTDGAWDDDLDGVPDQTRTDLADRLDLLGINYYSRVTVLGLGVSVNDAIPVFDFFPTFGWEPYPEGLGEVVARARAWDRPIWITENGTPEVDRASEVLDAHLRSLLDQIHDGADVRGYQYWSLVDNYEWNHGFDLRFGLYELDVDTKARTPRPVADRFRAIATEGSL